MTLRKRIDRLEGKRGAMAGPSVIVIRGIGAWGEPDPPSFALLVGGGHLTREDGETADAFTARAEGVMQSTKGV